MHSAPEAHDSSAPIFVSGRQHSGNTVMAIMLSKAPECYGCAKEGRFFERWSLIDRIKDPHQRLKACMECLQLSEDPSDLDLMHWSQRWDENHPGGSSLRLYLALMDHIASRKGNSVWVRKATSYIFYAEEIFRLVPNARMVYMVRNPYDVCASKKRRAPDQERLWGWVVSWNRGLRTARHCEKRYPQRFRIVEYEELARHPEQVMRALFNFLRITYTADVLDVPHINRSENPHIDDRSTHGLNTSRVYYYRDILSEHEIAALDMLVWTDEVHRLYTDLPHEVGEHRQSVKTKAALTLACAPWKYFRQKFQMMSHDPAYFIHRTLKRVAKPR